eukprot:gene13101-19106_t
MRVNRPCRTGLWVLPTAAVERIEQLDYSMFLDARRRQEEEMEAFAAGGARKRGDVRRSPAKRGAALPSYGSAALRDASVATPSDSGSRSDRPPSPGAPTDALLNGGSDSPLLRPGAC